MTTAFALPVFTSVGRVNFHSQRPSSSIPLAPTGVSEEFRYVTLSVQDPILALVSTSKCASLPVSTSSGRSTNFAVMAGLGVGVLVGVAATPGAAGGVGGAGWTAPAPRACA